MLGALLTRRKLVEPHWQREKFAGLRFSGQRGACELQSEGEMTGDGE